MIKLLSLKNYQGAREHEQTRLFCEAVQKQLAVCIEETMLIMT